MPVYHRITIAVLITGATFVLIGHGSIFVALWLYALVLYFVLLYKKGESRLRNFILIMIQLGLLITALFGIRYLPPFLPSGGDLRLVKPALQALCVVGIVMTLLLACWNKALHSRHNNHL